MAKPEATNKPPSSGKGGSTIKQGATARRGPIIKTDDPRQRDMILQGIGLGVGAVVWLAFTLITRFALGSFILAASGPP